jgi:hypothetical protein
VAGRVRQKWPKIFRKSPKSFFLEFLDFFKIIDVLTKKSFIEIRWGRWAFYLMPGAVALVSHEEKYNLL